MAKPTIESSEKHPITGGIDMDTLQSPVNVGKGEFVQFGIALDVSYKPPSSPDVKKPGDRDWVDR